MVTMFMARTKLGDLVRQRRKQAQIKQRVLADRMGVSREYISQIENGHQDEISREHVVSLSRHLPVTVTEILKAMDYPLENEADVFYRDPEKARDAQWLLSFSRDAIRRLRIIALQANLEGVPPQDEPTDEGDDDLDGDGPQPEPDIPPER